jgi:hypothetical protein
MNEVNAGIALPLLLSRGELWPSVGGKIANPRDGLRGRERVRHLDAKAKASAAMIWDN